MGLRLSVVTSALDRIVVEHFLDGLDVLRGEINSVRRDVLKST